MTENQTEQQPQATPQPQVVNVIQQEAPKKNGIGTAGFVLALVGLIFGWVPFFGWISWLLGLIFSFIGIFKTPKGLSIAGLVISLIGIVVIIIILLFAGGAAMSYL